jgi:hypothetical protein
MTGSRAAISTAIGTPPGNERDELLIRGERPFPRHSEADSKTKGHALCFLEHAPDVMAVLQDTIGGVTRMLNSTIWRD